MSSPSTYKVSNSELRTFKRCRRKWWLSYPRALRLKREGVGPLSIGNMIHIPLEMYYALPQDMRDPAGFSWEAVLMNHVRKRLEDPRLPEGLHPQMLEDAELAKIMLRGYFEWLQEDGADSELEILGAEQEVEAYLGEILGTQVYLIGKLDVLARLRSTGRRVFIDHKSVANMTDLPKIGELDEQQRMYGLLQRMKAIADGGSVDECASGGVWNMLRKVKRTARANPPFYARAGVQHNEEVFRTFHHRVWGEVSDLLAVKARLDAGESHHTAAYPNPTRDCSWDCPFFLVCARFDDGSPVEDLLEDEYEVHDPYERYTEVEKG